MEQFFGQRTPYDGYKRTNYNQISRQQAAQKSGCEIFFQKYIKKILDEGELSTRYMQRKNVRPAQILNDLILQDPKIRLESINLINLTEDEILVDHHQFRFAFKKIIENAIGYSEGNTIATLQIENINNAILITCKDQGIGISPYEKSKVFQPFFRGLDSAKFTKGIGLGLTLCKEIFHQNSAEISVESDGRGLGTEVYVSFQIKEKQKAYQIKASRPVDIPKALAY